MLGNDNDRNCYRLLRISDKSLIFARDITSNENDYPYRKSEERRPHNFYDELFPRMLNPVPEWENKDLADYTKSVYDQVNQIPTSKTTRGRQQHNSNSLDQGFKQLGRSSSEKTQIIQAPWPEDNFTESPNEFTGHQREISESDITEVKVKNCLTKGPQENQSLSAEAHAQQGNFKATDDPTGQSTTPKAQITRHSCGQSWFGNLDHNSTSVRGQTDSPKPLIPGKRVRFQEHRDAIALPAPGTPSKPREFRDTTERATRHRDVGSISPFSKKHKLDEGHEHQNASKRTENLEKNTGSENLRTGIRHEGTGIRTKGTEIPRTEKPTARQDGHRSDIKMPPRRPGIEYPMKPTRQRSEQENLPQPPGDQSIFGSLNPGKINGPGDLKAGYTPIMLTNETLGANDDEQMIDEFEEMVAQCVETNQDEPRYDEAMAGPFAASWREACKKEINSHLVKHGTLQPTLIANSTRVISLAWRLKRKQTSHSGEHSYKARLVVRGDRMVPPEFGETFAPVARWVSIRTILAIATQLGLHTAADDVETAFLLAEMDTLVFVSAPPGFKHLFQPKQAPQPGQKTACQLIRSIPGIRQGSRLFWLKLVRDLKSIGYTPTPTDPCILQKTDGPDTHVIGVWVDDLVHAYTSPKILSSCRSQLRALGYTLVSKANLEWHLGMRIQRIGETGSTTMDMESLIEKAAIKFGIHKLKPAYTPAPPGISLEKSKSAPSRHAGFAYRTVAASALYVSVVGRPESSFGTSSACRFMDTWGDEHVEYLLHVWRYLYFTRQRKLQFTKCPDQDWKLFGYADSSWADILDDRTSTMGYAFFLGSCLVAWSSKKQKSVALSSNHAEYVSLGEASREGIFLTHLLTDLGHSKSCTPFTMGSDSTGALALAQHPLSTRRNKHLETSLHWIREALDNRVFTTVKIDTTAMVADIFTKPLARILFERFTKILMGETPLRGPTSSFGDQSWFGNLDHHRPLGSAMDQQTVINHGWGT